MHFSSVSFRQFRNFSRIDLAFHPGINVLIGPNGSGKSNILEGLSLLATGHSHRGAEARHWIQTGKDESALSAQAEGEHAIALEIRQKRGRARQFRVNNRPVPRQKDWSGRFPLVSFSPEDLDLVKGEPGVRRKALNDVLAQSDGDYAESLARYTKILEERNAALRRVRDGLAKPGSVDPWDAPLLAEGARLTLARRSFLEEVSPRLKGRLADLTGGRDHVSLAYKPSYHLPGPGREGVEDANRTRLADVREGELALGVTLIGPHRDDVEFYLDNDNAKNRASQGQSRTLALAWKWEERLYLRDRLGREPVCLLDDVFSELDPDRRRTLTELLKGASQCFVAVTDMAVWGDPGWVRDARLIPLGQGVG